MSPPSWCSTARRCSLLSLVAPSQVEGLFPSTWVPSPAVRGLVSTLLFRPQSSPAVPDEPAVNEEQPLIEPRRTIPFTPGFAAGVTDLSCFPSLPCLADLISSGMQRAIWLKAGACGTLCLGPPSFSLLASLGSEFPFS